MVVHARGCPVPLLGDGPGKRLIPGLFGAELPGCLPGDSHPLGVERLVALGQQAGVQGIVCGTSWDAGQKRRPSVCACG